MDYFFFSLNNRKLTPLEIRKTSNVIDAWKTQYMQKKSLEKPCQKINGQCVNNIRYADDTVLLPDNANSFQRMIDNIIEASNEYRLIISCNKNKIIISKDIYAQYLQSKIQHQNEQRKYDIRAAINALSDVTFCSVLLYLVENCDLTESHHTTNIQILNRIRKEQENYYQRKKQTHEN